MQNFYPTLRFVLLELIGLSVVLDDSKVVILCRVQVVFIYISSSEHSLIVFVNIQRAILHGSNII